MSGWLGDCTSFPRDRVLFNLPKFYRICASGQLAYSLDIDLALVFTNRDQHNDIASWLRFQGGTRQGIIRGHSPRPNGFRCGQT